eukprot:7389881-Prymnesium_polylepis.1
MPGEADPAAFDDERRRELAAAPNFEFADRHGTAAAVGSIDSQRPSTAAHDPLGGFTLAVIRLPSDAHGTSGPCSERPSPLDHRYELLVRLLGDCVRQVLTRNEGVRHLFNRTGPGVQHVLGLAACDYLGVEWSDFVRREQAASLAAQLAPIVDEYVLPTVSRLAFGGQRAAVRRVVVSRSVPVVETVRAKSMLWHWDGLDEEVVKVIIYLTEVSSGSHGSAS